MVSSKEKFASFSQSYVKKSRQTSLVCEDKVSIKEDQIFNHKNLERDDISNLSVFLYKKKVENEGYIDNHDYSIKVFVQKSHISVVRSRCLVRPAGDDH